MEKLVVVTNGNYFARLILAPLLVQARDRVSGVLVVSGDYHGRRGLRSLWHVGRRTELHYTAYKVAQYAIFRVAACVWRRAWFDVPRLAGDLGIPVRHVTNVNSADAVSFLKARQPDLLVSVSCPQRIREQVLNLPRVASLNVHSSLLPAYAGLAPYYWVLSRGERETGVSVHYMTERFDDGKILVQKRLEVPSGCSAFSLFKRLAETAAGALLEAVELALKGASGVPQDLGHRSYYSNPTRESYVDLRRRGFVVARMSEFIAVLREEVRNASRVPSVFPPTAR